MSFNFKVLLLLSLFWLLATPATHAQTIRGNKSRWEQTAAQLLDAKRNETLGELSTDEKRRMLESLDGYLRNWRSGNLSISSPGETLFFAKGVLHALLSEPELAIDSIRLEAQLRGASQKRQEPATGASDFASELLLELADQWVSPANIAPPYDAAYHAATALSQVQSLSHQEPQRLVRFLERWQGVARRHQESTRWQSEQDQVRDLAKQLGDPVLARFCWTAPELVGDIDDLLTKCDTLLDTAKDDQAKLFIAVRMLVSNVSESRRGELFELIGPPAQLRIDESDLAASQAAGYYALYFGGAQLADAQEVLAQETLKLAIQRFESVSGNALNDGAVNVRPIDVGSANAKYLLGLALHREGRMEEAASIYRALSDQLSTPENAVPASRLEQLERLKPFTTRVRVNLAQVLLALRRPGEASDILRLDDSQTELLPSDEESLAQLKLEREHTRLRASLHLLNLQLRKSPLDAELRQSKSNLTAVLTQQLPYIIRTVNNYMTLATRLPDTPEHRVFTAIALETRGMALALLPPDVVLDDSTLQEVDLRRLSQRREAILADLRQADSLYREESIYRERSLTPLLYMVALTTSTQREEAERLMTDALEIAEMSNNPAARARLRVARAALFPDRPKAEIWDDLAAARADAISIINGLNEAQFAEARCLEMSDHLGEINDISIDSAFRLTDVSQLDEVALAIDVLEDVWTVAHEVDEEAFRLLVSQREQVSEQETTALPFQFKPLTLRSQDRSASIRHLLENVNGRVLIYQLTERSGYILAIDRHESVCRVRIFVLPTNRADAISQVSELIQLVNTRPPQIESLEGADRLQAEEKTVAALERIQVLSQELRTKLIPSDLLQDIQADHQVTAIVRVGELCALPWDVLFHGERFIPGFFYARSFAAAANAFQQPFERPAAAVTIGIEELNNRPLFGRLAFAKREAKAIADLFGDSAQLLVDDPAESSRQAIATETSFETAVGYVSSQPFLLHFALHGVTNDRRGGSKTGEPRLLVMQDDSSDGELTITDLRTLQLENCALALVPACDSNVSFARANPTPFRVGESLGDALLDAGARRVVVGAWKIDDETSFEMTTVFADAILNNGISPLEALTLVRDQVRRSENRVHPYYWAPLMLVVD